MLLLLDVVRCASGRTPRPLPLLFMSASEDALLPWGLQFEKATPVRDLTLPHMKLPYGGARQMFDPSAQQVSYELWGVAPDDTTPSISGSPVTFSTPYLQRDAAAATV